MLDNNEKGSQMKTISLIKVTAIVVSVAFASNFVNAEEKVIDVIEKTPTDVTEVANQLSFPALIEALDSDKNGMLSQAEASADQSKLLQDEFSKMDVNQDKQIDEAEFNDYLAQVKTKISDVAKHGI